MPDPPLVRLVDTWEDGRRVCRVCRGEALHLPGCGAAVLQDELREMTAALGIFVAEMRERLVALEDLIEPVRKEDG